MLAWTDQCGAGSRYSGADDLVVRLPNAYFLTNKLLVYKLSIAAMSKHATGNSAGVLSVRSFSSLLPA